MPDPCTPLALLRDLHRKGFVDSAIADQLSEAFSPAWWTPWKVWYWRRKLGLQVTAHWRKIPAGRRRREGKDTYLALYQVRKGLGHLLSYYDRDKREWQDGYRLSKRQSDVLALLVEQGPLTRQEIGTHLRVSRLRAQGLGLVVVAGRRPGRTAPVTVYAAAEVAPNGTVLRRSKRHETGIELSARAAREEAGERFLEALASGAGDSEEE